VQVDPIKPTLKLGATERLKLRYDEPPSKFASNFNMRRFKTVDLAPGGGARPVTAVGRCRLTL
jgi:hypothetical protein